MPINKTPHHRLRRIAFPKSILSSILLPYLSSSLVYPVLCTTHTRLQLLTTSYPDHAWPVEPPNATFPGRGLPCSRPTDGFIWMSSPRLCRSVLSHILICQHTPSILVSRDLHPLTSLPSSPTPYLLHLPHLRTNPYTQTLDKTGFAAPRRLVSIRRCQRGPTGTRKTLHSTLLWAVKHGL